MRRALGLTLVLLLMGLSLVASATSDGNYKDKFTSISWGGSDGSMTWPGPWVEVEDDGDEKKGNVRVVSNGNCASGNCIQIAPLIQLEGTGVRRSADTSVFGEDVELRFDVKATGGLSGNLAVQVDGGEGWVTLEDYSLAGGLTVSPSFDLSEFRSEDFAVRFLYEGLLLGSPVHIDNVEIRGELEGETTTTTTTEPTTTSTTAPPDTTTSTQATTTTTRPEATTSTTSGSSQSTTTTAVHGDEGTSTTVATRPEVPESTTTTVPDITTSTLPGAGSDRSGDDEGGVLTSGGPTDDGGTGAGGIREAARGLQASFDGGLFGEVRTLSSINGVDVQVDFKMAVETIEASWIWMSALGLIIAWAIVSGQERRLNLRLG